MRVTVIDNVPGRLVVRCGPLWSWLTWLTRIVAVSIVLVDLLVLVGVFDRGSLACDRSSGRCTAVHVTLFGSERHEFAAAMLRGASLRTETATPDQDGGDAMLQVGDDQIRLARVTGSQASAVREFVDEVNRFVVDPAAPRLDAGFDNLVSGSILVLLVMAAAVWIAWWGRVTTCTFDRMTGTYTMRRSVVIPLTRKGPLSSISKVEVQTEKGQRRTDVRHFVRLRLSGDQSYTIDDSNELAVAQGLQSTIQGFLEP